MPAGCGDTEYIGVMLRIVAPVLRQFAPEIILVSCGFDAHRDDPLAAMEVTGRGFGAMTAILRDVAEEVCEGKLVFVLEGGYAASGLAEGTRDLLTEMSRPRIDARALRSAELAPGSPLREVVGAVAAVHAQTHPEIEAGENA